MLIRPFNRQDTESIARLFHDTVREITIRDYSSTQVQAWAPDNIHFKNWEATCASHYTYVAVLQEIIVGFANLTTIGQIDCFYCHKHYQRQGIGTQLYKTIETKAQSLHFSHLITEASITAKPFFQQLGFHVLHEQSVLCRGEVFINYLMEKRL